MCSLNKDPPPPKNKKKERKRCLEQQKPLVSPSGAELLITSVEKNRTEQKKAGRDVCLQLLTGLSVEDTHRIGKKLNLQDELRIQNALRKVSDAVVYCVASKSSEFCTTV